jgi:hypothetical protein
MLFLDCLYLVCCNFYKKRERDSFKASGLVLLSIVFMFNIILLLYVLVDLNLLIFNIYENRYAAIGGCLLLIIPMLYYRYFRLTNFEDVNNAFYRLTFGKRNLVYFTAIGYVLISIISFIGYAVYKGGMINGWW